MPTDNGQQKINIRVLKSGLIVTAPAGNRKTGFRPIFSLHL